jgi:hypothetical protein
MLEARITDDPADVIRILSSLIEHSGELPCGYELAQSLDRLARDPSYRFVAGADGDDALSAAGVVTFFHQPMTEEFILGVEALWCRDDRLETLLPVLRVLTEFARRLEFGGVCIAPRSTNAAGALRQLVERASLEGDPVTVNALPLQKQGNTAPIASAFSNDEISGAAFISVPSIIVHTRRAEIDVGGVLFDDARPLYRGEGRLVCPPWWDCTTLDDLAAIHFVNGFHAREREWPAGSSAPFGGTIAEQLLHQGFVGQGAVSLSTSFEAAAMYATRAGQREAALVFAIDSAKLRHQVQVYDARGTLAAACPWIPADAWVPLRRIVLALWADLPAAGRFLERCYEEAFERARAGTGSLVPRPDPVSYLPPQLRASVGTRGLRTDDLERVHDAFEEFAEFALQQVGTVDTLHEGEDGAYRVTGARVGPMAYFEVFARVLDPLLDVKPDAAAGWDTTPTGYIAKTVRDEECFAAGAVPGDLITAAYVVDRHGRALKTITRD